MFDRLRIYPDRTNENANPGQMIFNGPTFHDSSAETEWVSHTMQHVFEAVIL